MKIAVYTAITAGKDLRKDPPIRKGVDQIIFTDRPQDHTGEGWIVQSACTLFTDPRRNSRAHKILAHQYLPQYEYSLWIDGSVRLVADPRDLVETYLNAADIAMFKHPARDCVYVEAEGCANAGTDYRTTLEAQAAAYRAARYPISAGLYECGVILRRHNAVTTQFNDAWWSEYCRHSCRDQVSAPYVGHKLSIRVAEFPGSIQRNSFLRCYDHVWR